MEFKKYKMEDIASFSQGKQVEIENQYTEQKENMKRFLRIIDFTNPNETIRYVEDFGDKYYATKDDLVMIRYGSQTCGKVVIGKEGIIANNMFKINLDNSIVLNRYAYYYLKQDIVYNYLRVSQNSSTMPSINFGILNKLEIEIPSIDNQIKIVKILNDIDKKIELNNEINNNLYELAINYLNEKVESNEVYVSNFAKIQGGYAFKSKDLIDYHTNNRIIKIKNLRSEINADVINSQFVEDEVVEKLDNKFKLSKGDVAIAMTGAELGKTGFIYGNDNYYLNQRVGVIRGNNKESELYLNILFLSQDFQTLLNSKGYGSAQPNVSTTDIEGILISNITEENLEKYYEVVKPIYDRIVFNSEEILNLEKLRDTLLPRLMNGEINMDNIEI